jgi:hypothetical protein
MIHADPAQHVERPQRGAWWLLLWVPFGLVAAVFVLGMLPEDRSPKTLDRRVIEACWEQYERKSLAPDEKRTLAGYCEGMERDYVAKYGSKP